MPRTSPKFVRALALLLALTLLFASYGIGFAQAAEETRIDSYDKAHPENLVESDLIGRAAVVMDAESGMVLFELNARKKTFPASTTKIVTCLLALELCEPDEIVVIPREAVSLSTDHSKLGVKLGEEYKMIDLLYGMMMKSGNDASVAVAMHISGSESAFAQLMTERVREMGCVNTVFKNAHGYHDAEHVTTAYEMGLIGREAMKNRWFRDIVGAKSYIMSATNLREKIRLETSNSMYVASNKYYYPDLTGVKTGFHSKAGNCFVGAATKNGVELISVILRSTNEGKWADTARLLDYGNSRYKTYTFADLFSHTPVYATVADASREDPGAGLLRIEPVPGSALDSFSIRALPEREDELYQRFSQSVKINYTRELRAPILTGDLLGTMTMNIDGSPITANIIAERDVQLDAQPFSFKSLFPWLSDVFSSNVMLIAGALLLLIIVLTIIIRVRIGIRNRRRRRELLRRRQAAYDRYRTR